MSDLSLEEIEEKLSLRTYKMDKAFENLNYAYSETAFAFVGEDNQLALEGFFGAIKNGLVKAAKAVADFFVMIGRWIKGLFIKKKTAVVQQKVETTAKETAQAPPEVKQSMTERIKKLHEARNKAIDQLPKRIALLDKAGAFINSSSLERKITDLLRISRESENYAKVTNANVGNVSRMVNTSTAATTIANEMKKSEADLIGDLKGNPSSVSKPNASVEELFATMRSGLKVIKDFNLRVEHLTKHLPACAAIVKGMAATVEKMSDRVPKTLPKMYGALIRAFRSFGKMTRRLAGLSAVTISSIQNAINKLQINKAKA